MMTGEAGLSTSRVKAWRRSTSVSRPAMKLWLNYFIRSKPTPAFPTRYELVEL